MEKLVNIQLHGNLGKEVGKHWKLSVSSIGQAIHGIEILSKRKLYKFLLDESDKGVQYKILVNNKALHCGKLDKVESIASSELTINKSSLETIDIIPVIEGAGDVIADIFTTVLGVVLIVAGIIVSGGLGFALITAGIGLTAAGVSSMLTKPPSFEPFQEFETGGRPSYLFSGPYNTTREGGPVPVVYGEAIVGSQTIAANYKIEYSSSKSGLLIASFRGDLDPDFRAEHQRLSANASVMSNINPVLDFDFHPEDDEVILAYLDASQGQGQSNYITHTIHILKYKDNRLPPSNKSTYKTHFRTLDEPFGDTRVGLPIRTKYKYPVLKSHQTLGKCIVSAITSDRVNNKVFVGGIFEHNLAVNDTTPKISLHGGSTSTIKNFMCIHSDGRVSNSDDHGTAFIHPQPNGAVKAIAVESSGKIIIGGEFTEVAGATRNKIARLNADGTLEDTFDPNSAQHINSIITSTVNGTEYIFFAGNGGYIKKYDIDANEDTAFAANLPNFGTAHIWALEIFNGHLVIGGNFSFEVNGITYQCLCRVNKETGELDPDFYFTFQNSTQNIQHLKPINYDIGATAISVHGYPRTTHNPTVRTLTSDYKEGSTGGTTLIVGGFFESINNNEEITTRNIFALKEDGSIDKTFNPKPVSNDSGPFGHIQKAKFRKALELSDNKIYIGGSFTHYNSKAYTPEETQTLSSRSVQTPIDRSVYNIARLYGKS